MHVASHWLAKGLGLGIMFWCLDRVNGRSFQFVVEFWRRVFLCWIRVVELHPGCSLIWRTFPCCAVFEQKLHASHHLGTNRVVFEECFPWETVMHVPLRQDRLTEGSPQDDSPPLPLRHLLQAVELLWCSEQRGHESEALRIFGWDCPW